MRPFDKDLTIYIVTTNSVYFPEGNHFQPIQGGRALVQELPETIGDDTGDNISHKNRFYAEVTPMYWAWKNAPRSEYVGFFHYRRFLNFGDPLCPDAPWQDRNFHNFDKSSVERFGWDRETILSAINGADLILPSIEEVGRPPFWNESASLYTHYRNSQISRDINLALDVIAERMPEDADLAEEVMSSKRGYFCQLLLARWDIFQEYMAWLFNVLEGFDERVNTSSPFYELETGQMRMDGFLAERLINIFAEKCRRRGDKIVEFERLFAKFSEDHSRVLKPRQKKSPVNFYKVDGGYGCDIFGKSFEITRSD